MMNEPKVRDLKEFLEDPMADISTGLIVSRGKGFCFVLSQPQRWEEDENGRLIMPFAGIGGKVEPREAPLQAVRREAMEEVGVDVKILGAGEIILLIKGGGAKKIKIKPCKEELPLIILQNPNKEANRRPFTNVLIYAARFISGELKPLDDPAIIDLHAELLKDTYREPISLEQFKVKGGKIDSRVKLPGNGFLRPIGTPYALGICFQENAVDDEILGEKKLKKWWKEFFR